MSYARKLHRAIDDQAVKRALAAIRAREEKAQRSDVSQ